MKLKITNKANEIYEIEAVSWEKDQRSGNNAIIVYRTGVDKEGKPKPSPVAYLCRIVSVEEI
jgi:hypothetical protein